MQTTNIAKKSTHRYRYAKLPQTASRKGTGKDEVAKYFKVLSHCEISRHCAPFFSTDAKQRHIPETTHPYCTETSRT